MPEEGFLRRWARVKASGGEATAEAASRPAGPSPATPSVTTPPASTAPASRTGTTAGTPATAPATTQGGAPAARPAPTLDDVARLTSDSDFSAFVAPGVDKSVQRLALKKLFADPHFNVLDRLDMYMDDYNKPSPVSAAMLASLDHARSALRRVVEDEPAQATHAGAAAGEGAGPGADELAPAPESELKPAQEPARHAQAAHAASPVEHLPHEAGPHQEVPHQHVPHNEAAHALAVQVPSQQGPSLQGEATPQAAIHDAGPSIRPNPHLSHAFVQG